MAKEKIALTDTETSELLDLGMTFGEIFDLVDRFYTFDQIFKMGQAQSRRRAEVEKDARTHQAETSASAMKRALMPENPRHPGISVYSHPEGELKRPKPSLRCETFWLNSPMEGDVDTVEEIELANLLEPGEYLCTKSDGSKVKATVEVERDPVTDKYSKVRVMFPTRGHQRHNHAPKTSMMREMIAQAAQRRQPAAVGA